VIIAILSSIILVALSGSRGKARDAQRISDLGQLQLALALFNDRCGQFPNPGTLQLTSTSATCPSGITLGTFIGTIPKPPSGAGQSDYDYSVYVSSGKKTNYLLHAKLESTNAAVSKGVTGCTTSQNYPANCTTPDPHSSPGLWSQTMDSGPIWPYCSNSATSVDYCIGPN
jgi:type II secretory pathway pseudopilin PulG